MKETIQLGCVSKDYPRRKSVLREVSKLGSNHTVKFSKGTWQPQSSMGAGEKYLQAQECGQSYVFILLLNQGQCRRPLQNLQRNEHCGWFRSINAHNEQKKTDELYTLRRSRSPTVVLTAGGELRTNEEAQVFVHDLNLFVTVQLLQETPAVLSLGKLCEDQRREDNCMQNGQLRTSCCSMVIRQFWKQFVVNIGTAGFVNNSCSRTKQRTCPRRLVQITVKNPKRKIKRGMTIEIRTTVCEIFLNSLEDFTDNGSACTRTRFSGLRFGTSHESGIKIKEVQYLYSVPKRPKLRHMLQNRNDKGSLQKTHWRSSTLSKKVCWLDDGRSQGPQWGPQWGRWISKQSSICCRGTRFGNSTESIPSVQNQNFSGDRKEFTKVPRAVAKTKSY